MEPFCARLELVGVVKYGRLFGLVMQGVPVRPISDVLRDHVSVYCEEQGISLSQIELFTEESGRKKYTKGRLPRFDRFTADHLSRFHSFALVRSQESFTQIAAAAAE